VVLLHDDGKRLALGRFALINTGNTPSFYPESAFEPAKEGWVIPPLDAEVKDCMRDNERTLDAIMGVERRCRPRSSKLWLGGLMPKDCREACSPSTRDRRRRKRALCSATGRKVHRPSTVMPRSERARQEPSDGGWQKWHWRRAPTADRAPLESRRASPTGRSSSGGPATSAGHCSPTTPSPPGEAGDVATTPCRFRTPLSACSLAVDCRRRSPRRCQACDSKPCWPRLLLWKM
jgi:hypothetical protein